MSVIIKILAKRVAVVRLQDGQRAGRCEFLAQLKKGRGQLRLREVLKEVAGKSEINSTVLNHRKVCHVTGDGFNTRNQMGGKTRPGVDGDTPTRHHVVDELSVAASNIEHAAVLWHAMAEKRTPKGLPQQVAA